MQALQILLERGGKGGLPPAPVFKARSSHRPRGLATQASWPGCSPAPAPPVDQRPWGSCGARHLPWASLWSLPTSGKSEGLGQMGPRGHAPSLPYPLVA